MQKKFPLTILGGLLYLSTPSSFYYFYSISIFFPLVSAYKTWIIFISLSLLEGKSNSYCYLLWVHWYFYSCFLYILWSHWWSLYLVWHCMSWESREFSLTYFSLGLWSWEDSKISLLFIVLSFLHKIWACEYLSLICTSNVWVACLRLDHEADSLLNKDNRSWVRYHELVIGMLSGKGRYMDFASDLGLK